ncbi:DMT family transporter, partial [Cupriavidus basilensis]
EVGLPLPTHAAEWSGLIGGMGFAVNECAVAPGARPALPGNGCAPAHRARSTWVAPRSGLPCALWLEPGGVALAPAIGWGGLALMLGLAATLVLSNSVVQYGLQRLPANRGYPC